VLPSVKKASFTGSQLLGGSTSLALMAAGLFGPANWDHVKTEALAAIAIRRSRRRSGEAAAGRVFPTTVSPSTGKTPANPHRLSCDWEPFFEHFGDATPQDAVAATLIAFGKLMCTAQGYNDSSAGMSRDERAARLQKQSQDWLLTMVKPLFGARNTVKVYMLLSHASSEIIDRGDLDFAESSVNEAEHKAQKVAFARTNRQTRAHARQLLTVAHSRRLLASEDAAVVDDEPHVAEPPSQLSDTGINHCDSSGSEPDSDQSSEADPEDPSPIRWDAGIESASVSGQGSREGTRTPLLQVVEWTGMANVAAAIGLSPHAEINLLSATHFEAVFEWDALPSTELLRSTASISGAPWYDHVLYRRDGGLDLVYGYVRLLINGGSAGVPDKCCVVQRLERTEARTGCPFAEAGYTHLRWLFDGEQDDWPVLEMVPLARVARIVHVVPKTDLLSTRFGLRVPQEWTGQRLHDNRGARFLHNILHKSTTPAQQRHQRSRLSMQDGLT